MFYLNKKNICYFLVLIVLLASVFFLHRYLQNDKGIIDDRIYNDFELADDKEVSEKEEKKEVGYILTPEELEVEGDVSHLDKLEFFIPKTWYKVDGNNKNELIYLVSIAKDEQQRYYNNNISFLYENLKEDIDLNKYTDDYLSKLKSIESYKEGVTEKVDINGIEAVQHKYTLSSEDISIGLCQTWFLIDGKVYFATYTSLQDVFDYHYGEYLNVLNTIRI